MTLTPGSVAATLKAPFSTVAAACGVRLCLQVAQANSLKTGRGSLGAASSTLESDNQVRVQPNPFLAVRGDTLVGGSVKTGVDVSRDVGDVATLKFATDVVPFTASGNFGAVLPGTIVKERGDAKTKPSDDNVAIRATNLPAMLAFGKKR